MKTRSSGFTLAEVLVSIVIGVISIAAAFASYNYFNKSYKSVSQKAAINSVARDALSLLTKELRNTGYVDPNYLSDTLEGGRTERSIRMDFLSVSSRRFGGKYGQSDYLQMWFANSAKESQYIVYMLQKYEGSSKDYYLAKYVTSNRHGSDANMYMRSELFIPYVEDFQIILKDKEGKILVPVCNSGCGSVEDAQGKGDLVSTKYGQLTKGQANVDLVHTAEIYLTLKSPKEVYAKAKATKIINGESPHGSNIDIPADKYHRETFFVSVHTRNLAKHVPVAKETGVSIGQSSTYNK
jgi:prepilin-type N-terminal cleavage/methylation domain-containing protein